LQTLQIVAQCIVGQFDGFLSGLYPAYFSNKEPISSLWNCLDVSGIFGVIVQRLPQLANRHPEAAVKINKRISRPEAASKFLATDYFSRVFEQRDQESMG
jgi:hypothetical protein